jgi:hypothetical protein
MEDRIGLDTVVVTEKVVVTDIKMKFWSMVWFMIKWVIASIPAVILLSAICFIISLAFIFYGQSGLPSPEKLLHGFLGQP